eukprot:3378314-Rhodomonas_salina.1
MLSTKIVRIRAPSLPSVVGLYGPACARTNRHSIRRPHTLNQRPRAQVARSRVVCRQQLFALRHRKAPRRDWDGCAVTEL